MPSLVICSRWDLVKFKLDLIPFTALLLNLQYGTILIWPMAALSTFQQYFSFFTAKLFCSQHV